MDTDGVSVDIQGVSAVEALRLEPAGPGRFTARSASIGVGRPVFGGQLLGQVVVAAAREYPDRVIRTAQVVFPQTGDPAAPLEVTVRPVHVGRTMGTVEVAVTQGPRQVCRATVLLDLDEADVLRSAAAMPEVGGPEDAAPAPDLSEAGSEVRIVGAVDLAEVGPNGPPQLQAWVRWPGADGLDRAQHQAIASWYTDSLMIGAAMRPADGVGGDMAHHSLSTGVITHTLTFHEPVDAAAWHLVVNECTYTGRGRVHGTGRVHAGDGRLVASFVQDAFVRQFPEHVRGRGAGVL